MRYFLVLISFFFIGCSDNSQSISPNLEEQTAENIALLENAPKWVKDPNALDGLGAIGSAFKTTGGSKIQQTEAMANGRDYLREKIKKKVSLAVKNSLESVYKKADKELESAKLASLSEKIGTHISLQSINRSFKKAVWFDVKENLYILVSIDAEIVKKFAMTGTRILLSNDREIFATFENNDGKEILQIYLEKLVSN